MIRVNVEFSKFIFTDTGNFQRWFKRPLALAFGVWGKICPDIAKKYKNKQYDELSLDVQKVMDDVCRKHGNTPVSVLFPIERKILSSTNWHDEEWTDLEAMSTTDHKLFVIGEIFIQIQWLWILLSANKQSDTIAIYTRSCALGQLINELARRTSLTQSGKQGGQKPNPIRERCRLIIQSPKYKFTATGAQNDMSQMVEDLKNIYFKKHKEFPQRKTQKGKTIRYTDKTLANWIIDFTTICKHA